MLSRLEDLAELYTIRNQLPVWQDNANRPDEPWGAVRLFLQGYAFERQGASPDYAVVAAEAIDDVRGEQIGKDDAAAVWAAFERRLDGEKPNYANNPLCPKDTRYVRHYLGNEKRSTVAKISAIELAAALPQTLVAWARAEVNQECVRRAHEELCQVNGVGDKIASFFLRDVATYYGLAPRHERYLLQPVDVWVRWVARILADDNGMGDAECAQFITHNAANPERANQGMWYYCAVVCHSSRYLVTTSLRDRQRLDRLVQQHVEELRLGAEAADRFAAIG